VCVAIGALLCTAGSGTGSGRADSSRFDISESLVFYFLLFCRFVSTFMRSCFNFNFVSSSWAPLNNSVSIGEIPMALKPIIFIQFFSMTVRSCRSRLCTATLYAAENDENCQKEFNRPMMNVRRTCIGTETATAIVGSDRLLVASADGSQERSRPRSVMVVKI
jgi:hypothetical protein